jgi:hypothetical protein
MNCLRGKLSWKKILLVAVLSIFFSCSTRARFVSKSSPEFVNLKQETYTVTISAIKKDFVHHNMFQVTISNTGEFPVSIDWNQSRWFINGKNGGKFVFNGINPGDIKEDKVKDTTIPPGRTEKIDVAPLKLIAWIPLKYKTDRSGSSISAGMLPKGNHGVHLVLKQNGEIRREKLEISILHEPIQ